MIRFMSDTTYAGVEQEMQHIPGFRPRRSGMVISHLSGCLENQRSLCESHVTDCVPFYELLEVLAEEVAVSTFVNRVCRLTGRRNPCFFQNGHRERFLAMGEKCSRAIEEAATCSAVYLLSADRFLWSRALEVIDQEGIHFARIHIHGVDLDGYVLFHMAKHIDKGIMASGLGCMITALFGGLPCTSYTQNIGIVAATGVASRRVTQFAGGLFQLYGFCPKMAYILAGIPKPVIGAVFLISAASIMFSGIDSIVSSPRTLRNTLVAGITLTLAVMLPYQCTSTYKEWADGLSPFLNMLCTSPVFIAVLCGVGLNVLLNIVLKES